jgi:hypothetical protein
MSRFFGILISYLESTISSSAVSASKNAVTSSVSVSATNTGGGILSYLWQTTGNACTINTPSTSSTTVTGGGVAGTTQLFCNITNSVTGVTTPSPICVITWNPSTSIISVTWSIPSATTSAYNGAAQSVTVSSINPAAATYSLATTTATNAGSVASTILTGTVDYDGTFTSPNLTIGTSTITIASSGSTSFAFNGSAQTVAYTVSGVYAADTNYSVSGTSATNCNNYTVTLSETSSNYTLGTPSTFTWAITPTAPASFTASVTDFYLCNFSWTAVGGCTYQLWGRTSGGTFSIYVNNITTTTTSYAAATNFDYEFYVVAVAPSGTSSASRTAFVYTGRASFQQTNPYNSGLNTLSPLCLSGSASGNVGLRSFVQGTGGIVISSVVANSGSLNFQSSLFYGTATRQAIFWQLNGTTTNQLTGANSAPAVWDGVRSTWSGNPQTRSGIPATGTVNYYLRIPPSAAGGAFPQSSGWSTNNSGGLSGIFWARISWRNIGTITTTVPAIQPTVTYSS